MLTGELCRLSQVSAVRVTARMPIVIGFVTRVTSVIPVGGGLCNARYFFALAASVLQPMPFMSCRSTLCFRTLAIIISIVMTLTTKTREEKIRRGTYALWCDSWLSDDQGHDRGLTGSSLYLDQAYLL